VQTDFYEMLELMDRTFCDLESSMINRPQFVKLSFGTVFRYKEKDIYQAMIQKLARVQSSVRAALLLVDNGFVQEQAILHRTIDETNEDIMFLAYAVTNDMITELHKRFLDAFWEEEIDNSGTIINSKQKRPMIPRSKIRAYLAHIEAAALDPSKGIELYKTLSKTYSGFVHGASPQIMDMYGGNPSVFHTKGMLGTPRIEEYSDDLWNYMYRSFLSHIAVSKAFGSENHVEALNQHKLKFEKNANKQHYLNSSHKRNFKN